MSAIALPPEGASGSVSRATKTRISTAMARAIPMLSRLDIASGVEKVDVLFSATLAILGMVKNAA